MGRSDISLGFGLAGLDSKTLDSPDDLENLLLSLTRRKDYGVVIVEEELLESLGEKTRETLEQSNVPLFIPISVSKEESARRRDYISEIIQKTIGYQIKLSTSQPENS